jgi:hypothetical protein
MRDFSFLYSLYCVVITTGPGGMVSLSLTEHICMHHSVTQHAVAPMTLCATQFLIQYALGTLCALPVPQSLI